MKRGNDDAKIMEPMFPRLHVNDTEKGGPRAPPRNKMALYEQLSIPSQRFIPSSPSQGSDLERNTFYLPEKIHTRQLGGASVNAPTAQPKKKARVETDFLVPVFVNSETGQQHSNNMDGFDGEKVQNICDDAPNQGSSSGVGLRNEVRDQSEESSKVCSRREHLIRNSADLSTREKIDRCTKEDTVSLDQGCENDARLLQKLRSGRQQVDNGCTDDAALMTGIGEGTLSRKRSLSYSEGNDNVPNETYNDSECRVDNTLRSPQLANGDKSDDASETSMVDSVSGSDIFPDDVVGIIGQKRFWNARRAIVDQQRVFAVQVFELHRLIKVQKLISGSPHILLEDTAYLSKPSFKDSTTKKLPSEFIVKSLPRANRKEDTEKLNHKMECSAENAVGKTSHSSVKNSCQPSSYGPFLGNPPASPVNNGDNKMNPWGFNQMLGQQWLVPVMSPSEGLVYKPYPATGFTGSACGGCGPFGQTPMTGNFMASAYGVSAPPHQGLGVLPGAPLAGLSYFPPYGMPVMNALSGSGMVQMNQFSGPGSHAHSGQLSGNGANIDMQQQSSCNLPIEKNGAIPPVMKFQASKDTEQQRCTASSPGEKAEKGSSRNNAEGKNAPPLLPTAQSIPEGTSQPNDTVQRTRVIRVVPHSRRSVTESAARIFQSIQKERKQYD